MIIDTQKWHEVVDRWSGILRYAQEVETSHVCMFDESKEKERDEKAFKIINKNDLTEWEIVLFQKDPFTIGQEGDRYLIENKDDTQNIQRKSLTIEGLDDLFYPYKLYESIISKNRNRFLDVPYKIQSYYHNNLTELIFQQKIDDTSYIYLMNFYLEDDEDPQLRHFHQTLITLSKAEILDGYENPDKFFDEQIEIFRILKKEGIVNEN
jgi:hypothetical protein